MYSPTPFGEMLRQVREDANLSQYELAFVLNKSAQYISNIEKGKNNSPPDDGDLQKLIEKLSLSADEAERFRLLAYADRGMLPPEMFRYVFESPPLVGLIRYAMANETPCDYWESLLSTLINNRKV